MTSHKVELIPGISLQQESFRAGLCKLEKNSDILHVENP